MIKKLWKWFWALPAYGMSPSETLIVCSIAFVVASVILYLILKLGM